MKNDDDMCSVLVEPQAGLRVLPVLEMLPGEPVDREALRAKCMEGVR